MQSKWNIPSATQQSYTFIPSFAFQGSMEHQKECQIVSLYQVRISYIQILDFLFNRHGYGRNTAGESAAVGFSRILLTRDLQILGVKFFPVPLFPVSFIPGLVKERKSHLWNSFMQFLSAVFCLHQEIKQRPCQNMGLSSVPQWQGSLSQPRLYFQEKALGRSMAVWEESLKIQWITKSDAT